MGVTTSGTMIIRARRVTKMVSVSPGGFVSRVRRDFDTGNCDMGEELDDSCACPSSESVCDRDREECPYPFAAFSFSVSVCVANRPGSTSSLLGPRFPLTRHLVGAEPPRRYMRVMNMSPNASIIDENDADEELREYDVM